MMNSTEKSLPEKLSDDIIAYILEEQLQPNDKLPNESSDIHLHRCESIFREIEERLHLSHLPEN